MPRIIRTKTDIPGTVHIGDHTMSCRMVEIAVIDEGDIDDPLPIPPMGAEESTVSDILIDGTEAPARRVGASGEERLDGRN